MAKKGVKKKGAKKTSATKSAKTKSTKRELIAPNGDKRYVRRDDAGQFDESDDAGKSHSQDRRKKAKRVTKAGHGDRGDRLAK